MIARWPGTVAAGAITHQAGHIIDFMPTFLELAKSEYPAEFKGKPILPVEGKSLTPILRGEERQAHESLAWELYGNRAIRQGEWKLVWGASEKKWELYNLDADRSEHDDLSEDYPERIKAMSKAWEEWRAKVGD